jgi:histidine triad (HIT) family protein
MSACLFCRIASGEIPAKTVYDDDDLLAFEDINPHAPMHVLVIPKVHVATLNDLTATHESLVGAMVRAAAHIAKERGFADSGYARCSTATPPPARPCSTSTCTCSVGGRWPGRRGKHEVPGSRGPSGALVLKRGTAT